MSDITIGLSFAKSDEKKATSGNKKYLINRFKKRNRHDKQNQHRCEKQNNLPKQPSWRNGVKSIHKSLLSTATHNRSSSHKTLAVPAVNRASKPAASTSGTSSLTITVKKPTNPGQSSKSVIFTKTSTPGISLPTPKGQTYGHTAPLPSVSAAFGNPLKFLAMDCEMVGTGHKGRYSELARCSIVSYNGDVVYDKYIKPTNPVTDFRTRWSGISWSHLSKATPFTEARKEILKIIAGKVIIGHAIHNDFKALSYGHPAILTRDTSRIPLLNQKAGFPEKDCASLKRLTKALFNRDIQTGRKGHSSVEDAKATMELYKVVEVEWERTLASKSQNKDSV